MRTGPAWSEARRAALLGALAVAGAHLAPRPLTLAAGAGAPAASAFRDWYGSEGSYRWSRERSTLVFPDPGPGAGVRIELDLAGWRPRGGPPPNVRVRAGQATAELRPGPRDETYTLRTTTRGVWTSDLAVVIDSDTFDPGAQDPRRLGVRLREARLVPEGPRLLARPPLGPVATGAATLLLLAVLLRQAGVHSTLGRRLVEAAALALGLSYFAARLETALLAVPLLALLAAGTLLARLAPRPLAWVAELAAASLERLAHGARTLGVGAGSALLLVATFGLAWASWAHPVVTIDLGSGRELGVASGFGPFDADAGSRFRHADRGAQIDLGDFGAGGDWRVDIVAAQPREARDAVIVELGTARVVGDLRAAWTPHAARIDVPFGWRPGPRLVFPEAPGRRVSQAKIDRGGAWPAPRTTVMLALGAVLLGCGIGGLDLGRSGASLAALAWVGLGTLAVRIDPLVAIPFGTTALCIAVLGSAVLAALGGSARLAQRRGQPSSVPEGALAAVGLGFVGWLTAAAYPLYRGGNFLFHSNIAEEIWKGRFWIYYLPFPGSMLSRQAQWGNILVPHPCLEQTLLAPLAALPQPWFHFSEKAVVSLWLAGMAWVAARLAATAGQRAATLAAVVAATLVPGYQLLGLGHLMTVLGCLGGTLALAFLALRLPRLAEAPVAWALVGFLTFAFLSYFAALLFSGLALGLVLALLARAEPRLARRLLWATAGGATLAFLLYYIHWALPFLAQSVPRILGGSAARPSESATPILSRLLLQPGKLGYSYGSAWIPLVGLAGLSLLPRGSTRMVVACWAAVLPVVSGLDVFFNFLLKHHYFVMVPVASGCGLVLARIAEHGRLGRATALLLVLLLAVLGLDTAYAVAVGQIP